MVAVVGNVSLLLDCVSLRSTIRERKVRPVALEFMLNFAERDSHALYAAIAAKSFGSDGETRNRVVAPGILNSKGDGVDFNVDSDKYENDSQEEEEQCSWEKEMMSRLKEIEERRELEKKAEELQSLANVEGEESNEETEERKMTRVRKELEKMAKEQTERRETAQLMFQLGQKAYEKGRYRRAIEFLEGALTIIPRQTLFGGEIQIWLAMAYEANNCYADCIALYKQLEKQHPSISIRRQAADLLYIAQAPKLKISPEEMVTVPLIGGLYDGYSTTWGDQFKDKDRKTTEPPTGLETRQPFWLALTLFIGLVGGAILFLQR